MIDRWFPGYVDAYYGPQEVRESINARDKPSIETLEDLAGSIQRSLLEDSALSPNRRAYLQEELRAMCTTIHILAGNPPDYINEVESLYGVTPKWVDESIFAEAHHVLNEVLPGSGSLRERVMGFKERSRVPSEVAEPIIRRLVELLRGRTVALFGLPPGEDCEVTFVRNKPWIAYNWYLGDYKSHIDFNQDVPIEMWNLPYAIAHEMYPGQHTEFAIKEQRLYRGEGRPEHSILLSNTPSSLISEGIAENSLEAVENEDEIAEIIKDCYEDAALSQDDAACVMDFIKAYRLEKVTDNQVLLLYRDHAPDNEIIDYGIRYSLMEEEQGHHLLRFYRDPLSRSYTYNYTLGRDLIAEFLAKTGRRLKRFDGCCTSPSPNADSPVTRLPDLSSITQFPTPWKLQVHVIVVLPKELLDKPGKKGDK